MTVLVTARPYAYQQQRWKIQGFQDTTLADFEPGQIRLFVDQWYAGRPEFDEQAALNRVPASRIRRPLTWTVNGRRR
jgi:hypothetical protein